MQFKGQLQICHPLYNHACTGFPQFCYVMVCWRSLVMMCPLPNAIVCRPYKDGEVMRLSHNDWELFFLLTAICIAALQAIMAAYGSSGHRGLNDVSLALLITPTLVLIIACLYRQCLSTDGGVGRHRQLSLRLWWRQAMSGRRGRAAATEMTESYCNNMLRWARDPLLADQLRERQPDTSS